MGQPDESVSLMISHVHHINFLVSDLNAAVAQYKNILGLNDFIFDSLKGRAVKTARIKLGDTWLVLVQPIDKNGIPAIHLDTHGEGFFLLSLGTNDIEGHLERVAAAGYDMSKSKKRAGLENWLVADLPLQAFFGAQIQLTKETTKPE